MNVTANKENSMFSLKTPKNANLPKKGTAAYAKRKKKFADLQAKKARKAKSKGSFFFFFWW